MSPPGSEVGPTERPSASWAAGLDGPVDVEQWEQFFALALDMLCIANLEGYFRTLNPAWERCLGWSTAELTARPFVAFVHPNDVERTIAETQQLGTGVGTVNFENRYRCRDGSYRWLSWTSRLSPDGRHIYAVAHDVSDGKQAEAAFRDQTARSQLLQRVAEVANTAANLQEVLRTTLDEVCRYSGWPIGHAYVLNVAGELVSGKVWHADTSEQLSRLPGDKRVAGVCQRHGAAGTRPGIEEGCVAHGHQQRRRV